jgi:hypothetical protein
MRELERADFPDQAETTHPLGTSTCTNQRLRVSSSTIYQLVEEGRGV